MADSTLPLGSSIRVRLCLVACALVEQCVCVCVWYAVVAAMDPRLAPRHIVFLDLRILTHTFAHSHHVGLWEDCSSQTGRWAGTLEAAAVQPPRREQAARRHSLAEGEHP